MHCIGFVWQGAGSGGVAGVLSVRRSWSCSVPDTVSSNQPTAGNNWDALTNWGFLWENIFKKGKKMHRQRRRQGRKKKDKRNSKVRGGGRLGGIPGARAGTSIQPAGKPWWSRDFTAAHEGPQRSRSPQSSLWRTAHLLRGLMLEQFMKDCGQPRDAR